MIDDPRVVALAAACVAFAIYLCLIGVGLRLTRQRYGVSLLIGCAVLVYAATASWAQANVVIAQWHFAAFYGLGVAATVFTYGAALKALSLRMLLVMAAAPDRSAAVTRLSNDVIRASFQDRIALLEERQLIRRESAGYVLTEAGRRAASRISRVQDALNMGLGGLYWD
jgi:hypothetical protein